MYAQQIKETLVGLPLTRILRAVDMLCLVFEDGAEEYRVHLQCFWRMVKQSAPDILFGKEDMYAPASHITDRSCFVWDNYGENYLDELISLYKMQYLPLHATDVQISECADLTIDFSEDIVLQVFVNTTVARREQWRFFKRSDLNSHIVAYPGRLVHE